jgi:hypothetical protein
MEPYTPHQIYSRFIKLSNADSVEYYPTNTNQEYTNRIRKPITTQFYSGILEVGLHSLYYKPVQPTPKGSIFKHPGDNVVKVRDRGEAICYIEKTAGQDALKFISNVGEQFKECGFSIGLAMRIVTAGKIYTILRQNQKDQFVTIDAVYCEALGLENKPYPEGEFQGVTPINEELFSKIDVKQRMAVTSYKDGPIVEVQVTEPQDKTVWGVINSINDALNSYKVDFVYDAKNITFTNEGSAILFVQLSPFMEKAFGVPENTWFSGKTESLPTFGTIDFGLETPRLVYVKSNIVEEDQYPNMDEQVIQELELPATFEKYVLKTFHPILYKRISKATTTIDHIKITLEDEHGDPIKLKVGSTSWANLIFRERLL